MNIDELKKTWVELNQQGLKSRPENEIQRIIEYGTSEIVSNINRKLYFEMAITAFASIVSAFGIVIFYLVFDPLKHTWIDASKLVPIQVLGFVIFLVLFLFGWLEYKLVNRQFTSESVKTYISALINDIKNYSRVFIFVILMLLAITFYVELNYFFAANLLLKFGGSVLLTAVSYAIIRLYFRKTFGGYLANLTSYQKELG